MPGKKLNSLREENEASEAGKVVRENNNNNNNNNNDNDNNDDDDDNDNCNNDAVETSTKTSGLSLISETVAMLFLGQII